MFGVMLQKLWHKKWMAFSLLVGITLLALVIYVFLLKKIGYIIDTFYFVLFCDPFSGLQDRCYPVVFCACSCMRILYL